MAEESARSLDMVVKKRLGEMLIEAGVISHDTLERALELQKKSARKLGAVLMQEGLIEERVLLDFLRRQLNVEVVAASELQIEDAAWKKIPEEMIKKYNVLPLRLQNKDLTVAMSDPLNIMAIDDLRFAAGCSRIKVVLAAEKTIETIIQEKLSSQALIYDIVDHGDLYKKALEMIDKRLVDDLPIEEVEEESVTEHVIQMESESPPIISLVNYIFYEAFIRNASDVHLEPYQNFFRVRFRIDGVLTTVLTPPQRLSVYIVSRVKIMSSMDISKRQVPQDGHLVLKIKEETIHFRVSTLPTVYGEKCVLRLLRKQKHLGELDALGIEPAVLQRYKKLIRYPQGMVVFTGPTGSGKTTTLYASLNHVNEPTINIITLEDPVESTIYGINHVQIRHRYGLEFADGLRSILRQDPDIIFVGEIRDAEVAEIAMRASMTGHLVFSTLHANSTAETFERLIDMGVESYLVSSTLLVVISQRLMRRVCAKCRKPYTPSAEEIDEFKLTAGFLAGGQFVKGEGCKTCLQTGYQGRVAAYEFLFMSPALRVLIKQRASAEQIHAQALEEGIRTILLDGIEKVQQGITTFDEVRRVLVTGAD